MRRNAVPIHRGRIQSETTRKVGYSRRWQLAVRGMTCDCGRPAIHYFGGPECQHCLDIRRWMMSEERKLVDLHRHAIQARMGER